MRPTILALLVTLPTLAATPPAPAAPPAAPELPGRDLASKADVDRWLSFFDSFTATAVADTADCTKMAADLNALVTKNQALLAWANAAKAKRLKMPPEAMEHEKREAQRMLPAMAACSKEPGVKAALDRLRGR
jgi:hypothetical protein